MIQGDGSNYKSKSPSPRRAWIEINAYICWVGDLMHVALPTEGVD